MKNNENRSFTSNIVSQSINLSSLYVEESVHQASKEKQNVCGDYWHIKRTKESTVFILCDGIGSGIKAKIAATMCTKRIITLLEAGLSLRKACEKVTKMMHRARTEDIPFAAFTIVSILNNGQYTTMTYESPVPFILKEATIIPMEQRHLTMGLEIVSEASGMLQAGDSIIVVSDGIIQAGLGIIGGLGWGSTALNNYFNSQLNRQLTLQQIADNTLTKAYQLSGNKYADDATIALLNCREANVLNLMTGPALNKNDDEQFVKAFFNSSGFKAVCGSTTSEIVARVLGETVDIVKISPSFARPPKYSIKGIDVVTEGAVTLNQVYNILDEDQNEYDKESCVSDIAYMMRNADIINLFIGNAKNPGHDEISFKQLGVLPRKTIISLIIEKLEKMGKTVVTYHK